MVLRDQQLDRVVAEHLDQLARRAIIAAGELVPGRMVARLDRASRTRLLGVAVVRQSGARIRPLPRIRRSRAQMWWRPATWRLSQLSMTRSNRTGAPMQTGQQEPYTSVPTTRMASSEPPALPLQVVTEEKEPALDDEMLECPNIPETGTVTPDCREQPAATFALTSDPTSAPTPTGQTQDGDVASTPMVDETNDGSLGRPEEAAAELAKIAGPKAKLSVHASCLV